MTDKTRTEPLINNEKNFLRGPASVSVAPWSRAGKAGEGDADSARPS